jgi:DNA-nicking Smr family endonuclease
MKKRKTTEHESADFTNNPFKTLKGFAPKPTKTVPATKTGPAAPVKGEDDAELFLRAVVGVKKIAPSPVLPAKRTSPGAAAPPKKEEQGDTQLFLQAMGKIGTAAFRDGISGDEEHEEPRRSQSGRMRRLRRGTIKISGELDLHGFLKDEALVRLGHFIAAAYAEGRQATLVITGKGINSPEGPVLQGAVAEWLRTKGKGMVAEFLPAPRDRGGSGAFVVFLKSGREKI